MAGMFDQLFAQAPEVRPTGGDLATNFIPLVGPYLAMYKMMKKRKDAEKEIEKNTDYMFSNPKELDPLGQRVQQRMLERSEGNTTMPGFMAQTMLSQEAKTQPRMANVYDSAAQRMTAAGLAREGGILGAAGNKAYGNPIKPDEAEAAVGKRDPDTGLIRDPKNPTKFIPGQKTYKPYTRIVGSKQIEGWQKITTNEDGEVEFGEVKDKTSGTRFSSQISFSPTIDTGVTEAEQSKKITRFGRVVDANEDKVNLIEAVLPLISPLTTGWAGAGVEFAGKAGNLYSAVSKLAQQDGNYAALSEAFNTMEIPESWKGLPTTQQSVLKGLYGALAYAEARANNSEGDGSGVRNLSALDIQDAYTQLGWGSSPQAMVTLLQRQLDKALRDMDRAAEDISDYTGRDPSKYQNKWRRYENIRNRYKKNGAASGEDESPEDDPLKQWLDEARKTRQGL